MKMTARLSETMLEILRDGQVVYDIPARDLGSPKRVAFWWRQLAGKSWMTPHLNNEIANLVCARLRVE
jgi:hypothetical protein